MRYKKINEPIVGGCETYHLVDLIRGVASIVILFVHYKHFFQGVDSAGSLDLIKNVQSYPLWEPIYNWGSNVVQLFWVISGFVFLHVYGGRSGETWRRYISNRFARLYPLHFLTLIIVLIAQSYSFQSFGGYNIYSHNDCYHFILNLFFASEWGLQSGRSFNGPIWSVSVEIFSYLVFFITIKFFKYNIINIVFFIVSSCLLYMFFKNTIILCLIYFYFGSFSYSVMKICEEVPFKIKFSVIVAIIFIFIIFDVSFKSVPRLFFYAPIFGSIICLVAILENVISERMLNVKYYKWIGETAYGNYLWHSPLQMIFLILVSLGLIDYSIVYSSYFILMYITVVIVVSVCSFYLYEKPLQIYFRGMNR